MADTRFRAGAPTSRRDRSHCGRSRHFRPKCGHRLEWRVDDPYRIPRQTTPASTIRQAGHRLALTAQEYPRDHHREAHAGLAQCRHGLNAPVGHDANTMTIVDPGGMAMADHVSTAASYGNRHRTASIGRFLPAAAARKLMMNDLDSVLFAEYDCCVE